MKPFGWHGKSIRLDGMSGSQSQLPLRKCGDHQEFSLDLSLRPTYKMEIIVAFPVSQIVVKINSTMCVLITKLPDLPRECLSI